RTIPNSFDEALNTGDLDFQHRFGWGQRQRMIWGGGYRVLADEITEPSSSAFAFLPSSRRLQLFSGFVQDEIEVVPDHWHVTLGTKLEHNDYSGVEVQPSGRLAWTPDRRHTIWMAISR